MFQILVPPDDRAFPSPALTTTSFRKIGVDDIADLVDCPKKFEYGKDFLPHSFVARLSRFYEKDAHLVQKGM